MFTFSGEIKGAVSQDMLLINSLKNKYKKSFSQSYLLEWRFKKLTALLYSASSESLFLKLA